MEFKMAEEVNSNFSSEQAPPVKSELQLVQERIANYIVPVKPNTANVINAMLEMQLSKGMVKPNELEAFITVRDDITLGLADYQQQVQNANSRMQQLIEQDNQVKMQELAKLEQVRVAKETEERHRRKAAEGRVAQMEAVLLSHGISMDLNGDGVIGVKEGTLGQDGFVQLTPQEQQQVENIVREQTPLATQEQKAVRKGNMGLARMMNPVADVPTEEPFVPLDTPQSHTVTPSPVSTRKEQVLQGPEDVPVPATPTAEDLQDATTWVAEDITETDSEVTFDNLEGDTIAAGEDLDSFFDEVDKVEEELDGTYTEPTPSFESTTEESELPHHRRPQIQETRTESVLAKPVVSGGNFKPRAESVSTGQSIEAPLSDAAKFQQNVDDAKQSFAEWADDNSDTVTEVESTAKVIPTYDSEEELLAAAQAKIDQKVQDDIDEDQFNESYEEETEEVTIPDRTDLEAMSKVQILEAAEMFEFDIPATISKGQMIDKFESETEAFIARLQDSGEFVSAEEDTNDNNDVRDGGYF